MRDNLAHASPKASDIRMLPLTAAQHGIWLGQQLDRSNPCYWTAEAVELHGTLDGETFAVAIRRAIAECDALHMRFDAIDGVPYQVLHNAVDCTVKHIEFSGDESASAFDAATQWMCNQLGKKPELNASLFSTALIRIGEEHHLWFFCAHHILLDGFGYALLSRRVASWYVSLTQSTHAQTDATQQRLLAQRLPPRFTAVIDEDVRYQQSALYQHDRDFWHSYLEGVAAAPSLADFKPLSRQVLHARGQLAGTTLLAWREAAQYCGTDWTAWIMAVTAIWIYRWSGCSDITIGLPIMGRMGSAAANVPCMFMNIVPLRIALTANASLAETARHIASTLKQIRPHQRYRYEHLKRDLDINGRDQRLFGPVINIMPFDRPAAFADLLAVTHAISAGPVEDIAISISPRRQGVALDIDANADAYSLEQLTMLRNSLLQLLEQAQCHDAVVQTLVASMQPSAVAALTAEKLLVKPAPVLQSIYHQALSTPEKIAVLQTDGEALTYRQLTQRAATLACELKRRQINPGDRVAMLMPRSNDAIVAMLGIFHCGAVYVPLDADGPPKRTEAILAATRPAAVVATQETLDRVAPGNKHAIVAMDQLYTGQVVPVAETTASDPAYVIYTSGSTGVPNGVEISHGALAHYVAAATQRYRLNALDRVLQFSPLHFDASIEEILLCLCSGATLVLRDDEMLSSLPAFLRSCKNLQISMLGLPTAFWHELVYALDKKLVELPSSVRCVVIGGEAASAQHVRRWHQCVNNDVVLINTYGPTEATVVCTCMELRPEPASALMTDTVAIGTPLPGLGCIIVNERLQPVPAGTQGELIIFGPQLATRYIDNDTLTHNRFITLPWLTAQQRAYRTGDIAMLAANGQLHFCGRLDNELKISGQRISTQQIEAVLLQNDNVSETCVLAVGSKSGQRLVAFVAGMQPANENSLLHWLGQRLLAAAMPSQLVCMTTLPKNSRGKIDRTALQTQWHSQLQSAAHDHSGDLTPLQLQIAECWSKVLGTAVASPHDDFFSLGGRSLHAITLCNRLSNQLGCELAVSTLYEHPSLRVFCEKLQSMVNGDIALSTTTDSDDHTSFAPLITLQHGNEPALFCVYPADGLAWCYIGLAAHLQGHAVYGLQAPGITGATPENFDQLIDDAVTLIIAKQPYGPLCLLGWSSGGGIAHAIATALMKAGREVSLLVMMDSYPAICWQDTGEPSRRDAILMMLNDMRDAFDANGESKDEETLVDFLVHDDVSFSTVSRDMILRMIDCTLKTMRLYRDAQHPRFNGDVLFFRATRQTSDQLQWQTWLPYVGGTIDVINIDADHFSLHQPLHIAQIARVIAAHFPGAAEDIGESGHAQ